MDKTGWLPTSELPGVGEIVIRLDTDILSHPRDEQAYWWGKSVHHVAVIVSGGRVYVEGHKRTVAREAIVGWMPLPSA